MINTIPTLNIYNELTSQSVLLVIPTTKLLNKENVRGSGDLTIY